MLSPVVKAIVGSMASTDEFKVNSLVGEFVSVIELGSRHDVRDSKPQSRVG